MDLDELKARIGETSLGDEALSSLLAAALESIEGRYGTTNEEIVERHRVHGPMIRLGQRAQDIVSVTESGRDLDEDEWDLRPSGTALMRLLAARWAGQVEVRYWPTDSAAGRDRITVALVKLDISHKPGLAAITIGTYSEQYTSNSAFNYELERESILASLEDQLAMAR